MKIVVMIIIKKKSAREDGIEPLTLVNVPRVWSPGKEPSLLIQAQLFLKNCFILQSTILNNVI